MSMNNLSIVHNFNNILISITRRILEQLSKYIPVLYNRANNQQIIEEQNRLMQNGNFNVFDILKTAIELLNPVIFATLKDETLRAEVTKNVIRTYPDSLQIPMIKILLLQEDKIPHLIILGSNDSCINDIFDVLNISYENKDVNIIPFEYFTLNYIIILKRKNFHNIYLKPEDCLINIDSILYTMIMKFIQFTAKILDITNFSVAHAHPRQNVRICTHGCNFSRMNCNDGNHLHNSNTQQSSDVAEAALQRQPEPGTSKMPLPACMPSPSTHLDPMVERRRSNAAKALLHMQSNPATLIIPSPLAAFGMPPPANMLSPSAHLGPIVKRSNVRKAARHMQSGPSTSYLPSPPANSGMLLVPAASVVLPPSANPGRISGHKQLVLLKVLPKTPNNYRQNRK